MKRLIVCCDGTWNTPDEVAAGRASPTNVTKIAEATAGRDGAGLVQRVYYHRGVGTGRWDHLRGGALGWGLSENIQDAYAFLVQEYEPGDELFLFGFSRGAYTVRSLAGLIRNCGILRREYADRLGQAYALYRRRDEDSNPRAIEARLFRRTYTWEDSGAEVRIRCIGVWDTVGALGIPVGVLSGLTRRVLHLQFHDVMLSSYVDNAFQALAVDERRAPFAPCLWHQQEHARGQRLEQVWFAGVHSNVGGGYPESGLSDLAFLWIKDRAAECGLAFDEEVIQAGVHPDAMGVLRDSRTGVYRIMPECVRTITPSGQGPRFERVAPSVYERAARDPQYSPGNLPPRAGSAG